ncbi:MAG: hypothetical protein WBY94_26575, partial [Polyangiaceae bacterium]
TLERALSSDINRAQLFAAANASERLRYEMNIGAGTDDLDADGAVPVPVTALTSPMTAEIFNGFRVGFGVGSLTITVDPGVMYAIVPDGDADSSVYKEVVDPGIASGMIAMTGNVSGSTRIDVVECQYTTVTTETDNRDVFNPATGGFAAASVTKVQSGGLTYRVRQGTPGSGFPGTASGWLPLAVASVPNGATSNDSMTFWDVRPLLKDRIFAPFNSTSDTSRWHHSNYVVDTVLSTGKSLLLGSVDVSATDPITPSPGTRRLGGRLRTSSVSADLPGGYDGVDLNDSNNWSGTIPANGIGYLYLLEGIYGLPRWARYSNATTGVRTPRGPRGFLVVSPNVPVDYWGSPIGSIGVPSITGLGGTSTYKGVCLGALLYSSSKATATVCDGRTQWSQAYGSFSGVNSGTGPFTVVYTLTDNATHMGGAKALWVTFSISINQSVTNLPVAIAVSLQDSTLGQTFAVPYADSFGPPPTSPTTFTLTRTIRVPWPSIYPYAASIAVRKLVVTVTGPTSIGSGTSSATVVGWDLF